MIPPPMPSPGNDNLKVHPDQGPLDPALPVNVIVDCSAQTLLLTNPTRGEIADKNAADAAATHVRQNAESTRAAAVAAVQQSTDPAVQALAQLLGIDIPAPTYTADSA